MALLTSKIMKNDQGLQHANFRSTLSRIKPSNFCKHTIHLTTNNMELKNITLAALLTTLLVTGPVESAGDEGAGYSFSSALRRHLNPSTVGDQLASSSESEEIGQVSHESSTGEGTSSVPVKGKDLIASNPEAQSFIEAVQEGDMDACEGIFDSGKDELKKYCGKYLGRSGAS